MFEIRLEYILKLMIQDGKQFVDWDRDYLDGEQVTYYYDKEKEILSKFPLVEFRNQGFF